jgi:hypothetical protein
MKHFLTSKTKSSQWQEDKKRRKKRKKRGQSLPVMVRRATDLDVS